MGELVRVTAKKTEIKAENRISKVQKAGLSRSVSSPIDKILFLQRTIGNHKVGRLMKSGALQAKLKIGWPGDILEQVADRVAEQVRRMPELQISRNTAISKHTAVTSVQCRCPGCIKGTQ